MSLLWILVIILLIVALVGLTQGTGVVGVLLEG